MSHTTLNLSSHLSMPCSKIHPKYMSRCTPLWVSTSTIWFKKMVKPDTPTWSEPWLPSYRLPLRKSSKFDLIYTQGIPGQKVRIMLWRWIVAMLLIKILIRFLWSTIWSWSSLSNSVGLGSGPSFWKISHCRKMKRLRNSGVCICCAPKTPKIW